MKQIQILIKKWVCSPHALKRIQERKISVDELEAIIHTPDSKTPQGPKWIFSKKFKHRNDNQIAAVLLERKENELWVVITVMVHFKEKEKS